MIVYCKIGNKKELQAVEVRFDRFNELIQFSLRFGGIEIIDIKNEVLKPISFDQLRGVDFNSQQIYCNEKYKEFWDKDKYFEILITKRKKGE